MKATFTHAAVYTVEAECLSPLRTAGADGDTESVLRHRDGGAFLQGTSLAGAMRSYLEKTSPLMTSALFGSQDAAGHLIISDAEFDTNAEQSIRPRLRIDPATGTADDGGKFDIAHINTGAKLYFTLTWLGFEAQIQELTAVESMLAALDAGQILLGAQKTGGFGRVKLVSVQKKFFDMKDRQSRKDWLEENHLGESFSLPAPPAAPSVTFTVTAYADRILVKGSAPVHQNKGSYAVNILETGAAGEEYAVLPGSSVKGAVRARATTIADLLGLKKTLISELFGRDSGKTHTEDNGIAGKIRFEEVAIPQDKKQKIHRIRINRFTGGVMGTGLFVEEILSGDLILRISAPEDNPVACGLLLYALRDLGLGLYQLGSGGSVGRGYLQVKELRVNNGKNQTAALNFDENRAITSIEDNDGLFSEWIQALGGMPHEDK